MTITATTDYDYSTLRITLPQPAWTGREEIGTGIYRTAIYVSPRAKRCVVENDSIWEDRDTGGCVGASYTLVTDGDELHRLAARYPDVAAALERAGLIASEAL